MALWSGRFEKGVSEFTQEFGASLPVDKAMYHQDIAGSRAHARMLAAQGVISQEDADAIVAGLSDIEKTIEEGNFVFDINDEDIHMSIEKVLTQNIGDAGARLHTGRSRNDQVITDTRLYAKMLAEDLMHDVTLCAKRLLRLPRTIWAPSCQDTLTCSMPSLFCFRTTLWLIFGCFRVILLVLSRHTMRQMQTHLDQLLWQVLPILSIAPKLLRS